MKPIEEFMRRYLEEHIAEEKRQQTYHAPFRQTFYTEDCYWDSRVGMLQMLESEKVVSVSGSNTQAQVTTTRELPDRPGTFLKLRYHLLARGDGWLISDVHSPCCSCAGEPGNESCKTCHGSGWRSSNETLSKVGALSRTVSPTPQTLGQKTQHLTRSLHSTPR